MGRFLSFDQRIREPVGTTMHHRPMPRYNERRARPAAEALLAAARAHPEQILGGHHHLTDLAALLAGDHPPGYPRQTVRRGRVIGKPPPSLSDVLGKVMGYLHTPMHGEVYNALQVLRKEVLNRGEATFPWPQTPQIPWSEPEH